MQKFEQSFQENFVEDFEICGVRPGSSGGRVGIENFTVNKTRVVNLSTSEIKIKTVYSDSSVYEILFCVTKNGKFKNYNQKTRWKRKS